VQDTSKGKTEEERKSERRKWRRVRTQRPTHSLTQKIDEYVSKYTGLTRSRVPYILMCVDVCAEKDQSPEER